MDFDLEFESGFDPANAKSTLESMLSTADSRLVAVMTTAGLNIERDAKRRVPVQSSNLRGSIGSDTRSKRDTIITEVGSNTRYAPFVEFGTSKMAAQPYLRPAMDRETRTLERKIRMAVLQAAEQEGNG